MDFKTIWTNYDQAFGRSSHPASAGQRTLEKSGGESAISDLGCDQRQAETAAADGGVSVRVVAPVPPLDDDGEWTICFVTRRSSRKAAEIGRAGRMALGYQHHPDRAYVVIHGDAALIDDRAEVQKRWRDRYRTHLPGGPLDPDTIFVKIVASRIELCINGVTPEPFGSRHSTLERDREGRWRLAAS